MQTIAVSLPMQDLQKRCMYMSVSVYFSPQHLVCNPYKRGSRWRSQERAFPWGEWGRMCVSHNQVWATKGQTNLELWWIPPQRTSWKGADWWPSHWNCSWLFLAGISEWPRNAEYETMYSWSSSLSRETSWERPGVHLTREAGPLPLLLTALAPSWRAQKLTSEQRSGRQWSHEREKVHLVAWGAGLQVLLVWGALSKLCTGKESCTYDRGLDICATEITPF